MFRITIKWFAPYPKELSQDIQASSVATATGRALRTWRKANKGKRINELTINIIKI